MPPSFASTIEKIAAIIDAEKRRLTNRELLALCGDRNESFLADPHLCHEIAETALNFLVATKYGKDLLCSNSPSAGCSEVLRPLFERLPTQTWRSETQITFQQFSTPVTIAYLAAYLLKMDTSDRVLEPSCGTGNLAVWAQGSGAEVTANEIDPRRRELGTLLGINATGYNAEFIDDLLPGNIVPNVILANPPFSSSGGRVDRNQKKFGFRHVESALRRLATGGRFAVILGDSGSPQAASGKAFWESLLPGIQITGSIALPGKEYYRNGTTVGITLVLGQKPLTPGEQPNTFKNPIGIVASSVEDVFSQALAADLLFHT